MELFKTLKEIQNIYSKGGNMMNYLKNKTNTNQNTIEAILISYDFQAGNYIKKAQKYLEYEEQFSNNIFEVINKYGDFNSLMEVGVGEATTFIPVIKKLPPSKKYYGFDILWSRVKYAKMNLKKNIINDASLFIGDLFNIPLLDNSIDFIYTSHSLEPNGGKEKEALQELYRVTNNYLFLFEPSNEFGDKETNDHIVKNGYVKNLYQVAKDLGYKIVEHKLLYKKNHLSANNTALLVIEKEKGLVVNNNTFSCPITNTPLELIRGNYFSKESLLLYPVVDEIPCLLQSNAIVATHYLDDFKSI